jgi:single-strand DNA-binding protein
MASYNKITVVGNVTRDPEQKAVGEKAVTKFSVAVNRKGRSGDETTYFDVVAWDRLGETCQQYLRKGSSVLVEGRLSIRDYEDKNGVKRKAVEVVASDMQLLDRKGAHESSDDQLLPSEQRLHEERSILATAVPF